MAGMTDRTKTLNGALLTGAAFALWGVLPLYWKLLAGVPPLEILAHRIVWSLVFVAGVLTLTGGWQECRRNLSEQRRLPYFLATAVLICANWLVYIYAVNTGRILESSLGYYITPLFSVALGLIFLRERLGTAGKIALALAVAGVAMRALQLKGFPWLSLALALSFAPYGLLKKRTDLNGLVGLLVETAILAPLALAYLGRRWSLGEGAFGGSLSTTLLLAGAGAVTAIPLLLFAEGAQRVPLATVGFTQYISPTLSLFLGVLVYGEEFGLWSALSFSLIWIALGFYTFAQLKKNGLRAGAARRAKKATACPANEP